VGIDENHDPKGNVQYKSAPLIYKTWSGTEDIADDMPVASTSGRVAAVIDEVVGASPPRELASVSDQRYDGIRLGEMHSSSGSRKPSVSYRPSAHPKSKQ